MNILTYERQKKLNTVVMLIVVFLVLQANRVIPDLEKSVVAQGIAIVTSKGIYELLIRSIYWLINNNNRLLQLYWGHLYLRGHWSYEYTLEGKVFFGVWEFDQDLTNFQVIGSGLDEKYHARTIVRSVSPLIPEQGGFFVLNIRNELTNDNARVFSKTTLLLDRPRRRWSMVKTMRATTEVFGGPSDRQFHPDVVFRRHAAANDIEDVINQLKHSRSATTAN